MAERICGLKSLKYVFSQKSLQEIIIKLTLRNHYLGQEVKYFQLPGNIYALPQSQLPPSTLETTTVLVFVIITYFSLQFEHPCTHPQTE